MTSDQPGWPPNGSQRCEGVPARWSITTSQACPGARDQKEGGASSNPSISIISASVSRYGSPGCPTIALGDGRTGRGGAAGSTDDDESIGGGPTPALGSLTSTHWSCPLTWYENVWCANLTDAGTGLPRLLLVLWDTHRGGSGRRSHREGGRSPSPLPGARTPASVDERVLVRRGGESGSNSSSSGSGWKGSCWNNRTFS